MKRFTRSNHDKVISGVCAGLGEYFNVDPTIIRITWIVLTILSTGTFILAYLICSIVIPSNNEVIYHDDEKSKWKDNTPLFLGGSLILIGGYYLAKIFFPFLNNMIHGILRFWPILLVVLGIYIITSQNKN